MYNPLFELSADVPAPWVEVVHLSGSGRAYPYAINVQKFRAALSVCPAGLNAFSWLLIQKGIRNPASHIIYDVKTDVDFLAILPSSFLTVIPGLSSWTADTFLSWGDNKGGAHRGFFVSFIPPDVAPLAVMGERLRSKGRKPFRFSLTRTTPYLRALVRKDTLPAPGVPSALYYAVPTRKLSTI